MTDASENIDLDELERFTDRWANNPHNGDTIYSLEWMDGPEDARTEASATLTVSGLLALVARVRAAEARIEKVREWCSDPCSEGCCEHCMGKNAAYEQVLDILNEGDEQ